MGEKVNDKGDSGNVRSLASARATGRDFDAPDPSNARHIAIRELVAAAAKVGASGRGADRLLGRLVAIVAGGNRIPLKTLEIVIARLELAKQGRPYEPLLGGPLPINAGIDERLRLADRLIDEASSVMPERIPVDGFVRWASRVCVAARVAARNEEPGEERESLFRRWLAKDECDRAARFTSAEVAALCVAFEGRTRWPVVMEILNRHGLVGTTSETLRKMYEAELRNAIGRKPKAIARVGRTRKPKRK